MGYDFYQTDKCLGSICVINGKNAYSSFNADLKELSPVAGTISASISKSLGSGLNVASYGLNLGGIKAIFYVGGACIEECYINT